MAVLPYRHYSPSLAADEFIAPGAHIIGRVTIGTGFSVWFNAVLRGDMDGGRRNVSPLWALSRDYRHQLA